MIIYSLEQALGNYVIENESVANRIASTSLQNVESRIEDDKPSTIVALVEASYLNEVFDFAIGITSDTSLHPFIKELKTLCEALKIFDIRNAVSHPNRPFPESYWYRSAAIASDPLIDKLSLFTIKEALIAAETGNINEPPDDWIYSAKWQIPNTLPSIFEHEITGLLGRNKEFVELTKILSKLRNNLIAVVAPGGIGKTSLVLQFLRDITLTPEWSNKIDALVYCTLKNEMLTTQGIEVVEAIDGLDQIKTSIVEDLSTIYPNDQFDSFSDACEVLQDKQILICIDNLETLLMKSQQEFIAFNQDLPLKWRVLVTSRVSVDSATTLPIEPLNKRYAINLTRDYLKKRGDNSVEHKQIETIAERANYNPLAIRLTVDTYLKGVDISNSIDSSQKNIASFSYRNLIDSLSEDSVSILEATYAIGKASKTDFISLLRFSSEQVVESINELSKTSLLNRSTNSYGVDNYQLNESIRDLLLLNPRNISVRSKIGKAVQKRRSAVASQDAKSLQSGINKYDQNFVNPATDDNNKLLLFEVNKSLSYKNPSLKILKSHNTRLLEAISHQPSSTQLLYSYARLLDRLKNRVGAIEYLERARRIEESPRIELELSTLFYYESEFEKCIEIIEKLIDLNLHNDEKSSSAFAFRLVNVYLNALLRAGNLHKVLDFTSEWKTKGELRPLYGTRRALAYKRLVEFEIDTDPTTCENHLKEALTIFNDLFDLEGYQYYPCSEAFKFIKQIYAILRTKSLAKILSGTFKMDFLSFLSTHFFEIVSADNKLSIDGPESTEILEFSYELFDQNNPLHSVPWYKYKAQKIYDDEHMIELAQDGYTLVTISHVPISDEMHYYLFAEDSNFNSYYLNSRTYEGSLVDWAKLDKGDMVAIRYNQSNKKANPATVILPIDQIEI